MQNLNPNPNDETLKTIMRYHLYIFNDKTHDSYFVQHCLLLHWEDMVKGGFRLKQHWIWFDGCCSQFKSKIPLYFVSSYPHLTSGCSCMWNFFGSKHGKGPCARTCTIVKRFVKQVQLNTRCLPFQNAKQVVMLLHEHFKLVSGNVIFRRPKANQLHFLAHKIR
jgi:hypothetical protein